MKQQEHGKALHTSHIDKLNELISDMKYGSVTLVVQDGKIIQIDKTEKFRVIN